MKTIAALVTAAVLVAAPAATAAVKQHHTIQPRPSSLKQLERRQHINLVHARGVLRFFARRHLDAASLPRHAARELHWAYKAAVTPAWLVRELRETRAAIRARTQPAWMREPVRHLALWTCIHGGEGAWGAVGRGVAAGHYNGLQMTWGWGPLDGNPNAYTPGQILAAAEYEYRLSGYSSAWLSGQWGQTIGPCWGYAS